MAKSARLSATSDAGLLVRFFVVASPATVAAWQWGRDSAPQVKTAGVVRQEFLIER